LRTNYRADTLIAYIELYSLLCLIWRVLISFNIRYIVVKI